MECNTFLLYTSPSPTDRQKKKKERGEKGGKEGKEEGGKERKVYKVRHPPVNLYYGRKPDRHTRLSVYDN